MLHSARPIPADHALLQQILLRQHTHHIIHHLGTARQNHSVLTNAQFQARRPRLLPRTRSPVREHESSRSRALHAPVAQRWHEVGHGPGQNRENERKLQLGVGLGDLLGILSREGRRGHVGGVENHLLVGAAAVASRFVGLENALIDHDAVDLQQGDQKSDIGLQVLGNGDAVVCQALHSQLKSLVGYCLVLSRKTQNAPCQRPSLI